ncbi:LOW QUALITY PROTEIN: apolipoprotein A-IV [Mycteria americana]|uniref:LOW QUALITY PROTEIN: apolipoprotein A-IV n=1 Tax=Mycteria americana TaxID=33587 RepID=UPI003F58CD7E
MRAPVHVQPAWCPLPGAPRRGQPRERARGRRGHAQDEGDVRRHRPRREATGLALPGGTGAGAAAAQEVQAGRACPGCALRPWGTVAALWTSASPAPGRSLPLPAVPFAPARRITAGLQPGAGPLGRAWAEPGAAAPGRVPGARRSGQGHTRVPALAKGTLTPRGCSIPRPRGPGRPLRQEGAMLSRTYAVSRAPAHPSRHPPEPVSCPAMRPRHGAAGGGVPQTPRRPPGPVPCHAARPGYRAAGAGRAIAASHGGAGPGAAPRGALSAPPQGPCPQEGLSPGVPARAPIPSLPWLLAPRRELAGPRVMSGPRTRQALPRCDLAKVQARGLCHRPAWKPPRALGCINSGRAPPARQVPAPGSSAGERLRMSPKAAALVLVLLAVSGARADVNPDEVASVLWQYFTKLGSDAKETVDQLQRAEITKQLNTLLEGNLQSVNAYAKDLQQRLVPFATELQARLAQDSQRLKEQIQRELAELQAKLAPYADEVHQQIGSNIRQLRAKMSPYADELRAQVDRGAGELRRALEPYAAELRDRLQDNAESVQASLGPYADRLQRQIDGGVESLKERLAPLADQLKAQVGQSVEQLRQGLSPYAQEVQDNLNRQLESLTAQMEKAAEELRARLAASSEELRAQLSPLAQELRQAVSGDAESLQQRLAALAQQLDERVGQTVEAFRQQAAPFGESFGQQLVERLEEMRGKLDSGAAGVEDHLQLLEKEVREKVAAFLSTAQPAEN